MGHEEHVLHGYASGQSPPGHGDRPRKDNVPVRVTTSMHELVERASNQNFVPVVDDKDAFIGLITRKAIIRYCREKLFPED